MEDSNANIYLINIYTFTKFGEILSICPQDIAQKQNPVAKTRAITLLQIL